MLAVRVRLVDRADAAGRVAAQATMWRTPASPVGADDLVDLAFEAETQVRWAAGFSPVSSTMRFTVAWVRSRVEPPAP